MSSLDLERDRAMLEEARRLFASLQGADLGELLEDWRGRMGPAAADQFEAAEREVTAELRRAGELTENGVVVQNRGLGEWSTRLFAALTRCYSTGNFCEHALHGDRPLTGLVAARVISCRACLIRFVRPVAEADARALAGEAYCDFCLEDVADNYFKPTVAQYGPVILYGDACVPCHELALAEASSQERS
jgi:hypothetical protein